jgi:hypothetical protein
MVKIADLRWHRGRRRQALMRLREKHCGTVIASAAQTPAQAKAPGESRLSD